ncbi:MAG: hypothetical protein AAFN27_03945 [Pseudomonadota bacterium]
MSWFSRFFVGASTGLVCTSAVVAGLIQIERSGGWDPFVNNLNEQRLALREAVLPDVGLDAGTLFDDPALQDQMAKSGVTREEAIARMSSLGAMLKGLQGGLIERKLNELCGPEAYENKTTSEQERLRSRCEERQIAANFLMSPSRFMGMPPGEFERKMNGPVEERNALSQQVTLKMFGLALQKQIDAQLNAELQPPPASGSDAAAEPQNGN